MTKNEWAKNLVDSEYFKEVFDEMIQLEMGRILNSRDNEVRERESAYTMIKAYNQIYANIESLSLSNKIVEKRWKIF